MATGQNAPPGVRHAHMDVLYSSSLFRTVSKNDAIAAIRAWTETVSRQNGFLLDCNVSVAEDVAEIRRRLQEGLMGLVLVDPLEYFELAGSGLLDPVFTATRGKGDESLQFLLVANREPGLTTISGLRGKTLAIQTDSRADLGRMWIEVLLQEDGLGRADRFFSSVNSAFTPSAAVLPVFFGKVGAGVVDRASFEVMKEMNPANRIEAAGSCHESPSGNRDPVHKQAPRKLSRGPDARIAGSPQDTGGQTDPYGFQVGPNEAAG